MRNRTTPEQLQFDFDEILHSNNDGKVQERLFKPAHTVEGSRVVSLLGFRNRRNESAKRNTELELLNSIRETIKHLA